jgi:hypothetical protein
MAIGKYLEEELYSERYFLMCYFQVPYKRNEKPWKDSLLRFPSNQVDDKVIIL